MDDRAAFSLSDRGITLGRDGKAVPVIRRSGPPQATEGWDIGIARMKVPPPHAGEMHPDGDELLYLLKGRISVILEEAEHRTIDLQPGECVIIPQGIWHRLLIHDESELLYVTPGPHGKHRPLQRRNP